MRQLKKRTRFGQAPRRWSGLRQDMISMTILAVSEVVSSTLVAVSSLAVCPILAVCSTLRVVSTLAAVDPKLDSSCALPLMVRLRKGLNTWDMYQLGCTPHQTDGPTGLWTPDCSDLFLTKAAPP